METRYNGDLFIISGVSVTNTLSLDESANVKSHLGWRGELAAEPFNNTVYIIDASH